MTIPAHAPPMKQAQRTQVSPGPQVHLRGLAYEVGALGVQPGRSTEALDDARTVDYSCARGSMQSGDAPSSATSEQFVGDSHLRHSGRNDARCTGATYSSHSRTALSSMSESPIGERERQRDRSGHGRRGGIRELARSRFPKGLMATPRSPRQGGLRTAFSSSLLTATVVRQHPHVDGVLGARVVNFQMPLLPSILAQSRHAGCLRTDQAGRPQETEQTGSSCGTFVAHKGEKPWSAGSASVKQPSTKRRIVSVPCGIRPHS